MNILLTGASSAIGRTATTRLIAAGHRVLAVAQRPHAALDRRAELVCIGLDDPALEGFANSADVVIHLAPVEPGVPDSEGIVGVVRISHLAARAGARLLFVSQAAGDRRLYGQAEHLVASSWGPSLVIRAAAPVGRDSDWAIERTVATISRIAADRSMQVLHTDDLHRFLVRSAGSHRTGTVDLATEAITAASARRWLGPVAARLRRGGRWPALDSGLDLTALHRDWDFSCGWNAADALADTGYALADPRPPDVGGCVRDDRSAESHDVSAGIAGEFDDTIDPAFPVFSARGTSDALPGPLTPMTIDVQCAGLRTAHRTMSELLGLRGGLAREWQQRATAVFGHRVFTGVSVADSLAADVPKRLHRPAVAARMVSVCRHYSTWCDDYSRLRAPQANGWAAMSDAALDTRIMLLRDRIHQGWSLASVGAFTENMLTRMVDSDTPAVPAASTMTATGHLAVQTARVATLLRRDERLRDLAAAGDLAGIREEFADAATVIDQALRLIGHRGPGEAELANPMIAQSPAPLLAAAAVAADTAPESGPATPDSGRGPLPIRRAEHVGRSRQVAWDVAMRNTQQLRTALQEKGVRLAGRRVLAVPDDIFFLTLDEALAPPVDTRLRIGRRRAERQRLQALHMPHHVSGQWSPVAHPGRDGPSDPGDDDICTADRELQPQGQA